MNVDGKLLTLEDALVRLSEFGIRVSLSGLRLWIRQGKVASCRLGKRRYIPAIALQGLLSNALRNMAL